MMHLERILELEPYTPKTDVATLMRRRRPLDDGLSPLTQSLPGTDDCSYRLTVEFDRDDRMVFGELVAAIKGEDKALSEFHQLTAALLRTGVIEPNDCFVPPIKRSTIPMMHLLAWGSWVRPGGHRLQAVVGIPFSASAQTLRTHLAVSVHVDPHLPGYGPRMGDISTSQAQGWTDYDRFARPDLAGRTVVIRDAQTTIHQRAVPGPEGPDTMFRIFR